MSEAAPVSAVAGQHGKHRLEALSDGIVWFTHHRLFHGVRGVGGGLAGLNLVYLACVSLMPFSSALTGQFPRTLFAQSFYPGSMIALSGTSLAPHRDVHRHPDVPAESFALAAWQAHAPAVAGSTQAAPPSPGVFRVVGHDCRGRDYERAGFQTRTAGNTGIVTVLHAVVGCRTVSADGPSGAFADLVVIRVDVRRDLALLSNERLAGLPASAADTADVGEPAGASRTPLAALLDAEARMVLADRRSPAPDVGVYRPEAAAIRGDASALGAPVLGPDGRVIGVLDGLASGRVSLRWTVPWNDVDWTPPVQNETDMDRLAGLSTPLW